MNSKSAIVLSVNDDTYNVYVRTATTLLEVLRSSLGLTGTKRGCNHGVCGACTILLDGKLARSCLTLAIDVDDRPITTIEGIASEAELSTVQRALVDAGAIQCGFCTPGFVITLTELFARVGSPDREQIRSALSGNLCRCSGYVKIVEAAERLAAVDRGHKR
jgi:aerobic carbon-monoxide dehydrogenase small subunit